MCVLQHCADPTTPGVWWRDDAEWRPYDSVNQQRIRVGLSQGLNSIDLGFIPSKAHPAGARYTADLTTMQQINVSSGQPRDIKVIDRVSSSGSQGRLPNIPIPVEDSPRRMIAVHSRDGSGQLRQYETQLGDALLRALIGNEATLEYNTAEGASHKLLFDLTNMKQIGTNGEDLDVIIEVVWSPVTLSTTLSSKMFRRKVVSDLIDHYVRSDRLLKFLKFKLSPRKLNATHYSPFLGAGNRVYDSFVDFFESSIFGKVNGDRDQLLQIANMANPSTNPDGLLKIVFSAKPSKKDRHTIFEHGVDVETCSFSVFALESVASAIDNMQKLLVFIVILDAAAPLTCSRFFCGKRQQHLPVAEIYIS